MSASRRSRRRWGGARPRPTAVDGTLVALRRRMPRLAWLGLGVRQRAAWTVTAGDASGAASGPSSGALRVAPALPWRPSHHAGSQSPSRSSAPVMVRLASLSLEARQRSDDGKFMASPDQIVVAVTVSRREKRVQRRFDIHVHQAPGRVRRRHAQRRSIWRRQRRTHDRLVPQRPSARRQSGPAPRPRARRPAALRLRAGDRRGVTPARQRLALVAAPLAGGAGCFA